MGQTVDICTTRNCGDLFFNNKPQIPDSHFQVAIKLYEEHKEELKQVIALALKKATQTNPDKLKELGVKAQEMITDELCNLAKVKLEDAFKEATQKTDPSE